MTTVSLGLGQVARRRAAEGLDRLRATAWSIAQGAVGAALAWVFAQQVLGHERPFFAAVAALVCLGLSSAQRLRRVGELAVGVTLGVGIADLLISRIGSGAWQIAAVVALSMAVAQLLDGGHLVTAQAGVQAVLVAGLPPTPGGNLVRWEDALVGGLVALLVAALAPADPRREVSRSANRLVAELADIVTCAAAAIRTDNAAMADAALDRARGTQGAVNQWEAALDAGEEISRISPLRRRRRPDLVRYRHALTGIDLATRNLRVVVRRVAADLDRGEPPPPAVAEILEELAAVLHAMRAESLHEGQDAASARALVALAPRLDPATLAGTSFSTTVLVGQLRSAVVDLLGVRGMDVEAARALLPDA